MKDELLNNWKAPRDEYLPNFIIGGAMKSGTSTLHTILAQHPKVFLPEEEVGFFDIDNIAEHFDFNFFDKQKKEWIFQDMQKNPDALWNWYGDKFKDGHGLLCGEDSTTYITSEIAAQRIALQKKEIKVLFMLRQPSKRAYSNYHHLLRSGIVDHTFEDTLQFNPQLILHRSLYKQQLAAYYKHLPKEQIKVIVFEELVSEPKKIMAEVCDFLGIDVHLFDPEVFNTHSNKGKLPTFFWLQRFKNRFSRGFGNSFYLKILPFRAPDSVIRRFMSDKILNRISGTINPLKEKAAPKMNEATKDYLDTYFKKELSGLDELVGQEVLSKWFK